jgi:metal-dependent HD superfamily phosphatase/phosphodiesterase
MFGMAQRVKHPTVAEATIESNGVGETETKISVQSKRPIQPQVAAVPPLPVATTPATTAQAMPVTYQMVEHDADVRKLIDHANRNLGVVGYTEHGLRHVTLVSRIARNVVRILGYDEHTQELAAIAGILHDIGNVVNRHGHPHHGAVMAMSILQRLGTPMDDIAIVMGAIGSHGDDGGGLAEPVHAVCAALIVADKSDVHRSRVRNPDPTTFDAHDRVNYAVTSSFLRVDAEEKTITLELTIDTAQSSVMDYFEIFLPRMLQSKRAAEFLGCRFHIDINGNMIL